MTAGAAAGDAVVVRGTEELLDDGAFLSALPISLVGVPRRCFSISCMY